MAVAATETASIHPDRFAARSEICSGIIPAELMPATMKKPATNHGSSGAAGEPAADGPLRKASATSASTGASSATRASLTMVAVSPAIGDTA